MKTLETIILAFAIVLFLVSALAGDAMHRVYMEAHLSSIEPDTLLAMSLADLSNVTIVQRVL